MEKEEKAERFLKDKGLITNPHKVFIIQGKFGAVSLNDLLIEFNQLQSTPTQDKETFLKAADERIIPNIKDHYFSHDMINEEGQYVELYEVYDVLKWAFETLTKPQKDFLTWYTTGNNKHYSGDKLIEKYKKEVLNQ